MGRKFRHVRTGVQAVGGGNAGVEVDKDGARRVGGNGEEGGYLAVCI